MLSCILNKFKEAAMKINKLKILTQAICFLVSGLYASTQCMDETAWFGYMDCKERERHIIVDFSVDEPKENHNYNFKKYKELSKHDIEGHGDTISSLFYFEGSVDLDFRNVENDNHISFIENLLDHFMENEENWPCLEVFDSFSNGRIQISHFVNNHDASLVSRWGKKLDCIYREIDRKLEKARINERRQKRQYDEEYSGKNFGQLQREYDEGY
jgi:hypothetical protein